MTKDGAVPPELSAHISIDVVDPHPEARHEERTQATDLASSLNLARSAELDLDAVAASLGEFRIVRQIGRGAMGAVYLAEHRDIGSHVAVKVLKPELANDARLVEQFYDEARAVNRIGHPGIVRIFDLKRVAQSHYALVMEYLDGRPVSSVLREGITPGTALTLLPQVCDALDAAHRVGVFHRDIKPDNLLVLRRGRREVVKLLDFGAARLQSGLDGAKRPEARLIVGTPGYMSPEQWKGGGDGRSDLYSVGVLGYLMVTGRLPFDTRGRPLKEIFRAHREETPVDPRSLNPRLSDSFAEALLKALAKNPEDRFQTAGEMALALRRATATGGKRTRKRASEDERASSTSAVSQTSWSFLPAAIEAELASSPATEFTVSGQVWTSWFQSAGSSSTCSPG